MSYLIVFTCFLRVFQINWNFCGDNLISSSKISYYKIWCSYLFVKFQSPTMTAIFKIIFILAYCHCVCVCTRTHAHMQAYVMYLWEKGCNPVQMLKSKPNFVELALSLRLVFVPFFSFWVDNFISLLHSFFFLHIPVYILLNTLKPYDLILLFCINSYCLHIYA